MINGINKEFIKNNRHILLWAFKQGYKLAKEDYEEGIHIDLFKTLEYFENNLEFMLKEYQVTDFQ